MASLGERLARTATAGLIAWSISGCESPRGPVVTPTRPSVSGSLSPNTQPAETDKPLSRADVFRKELERLGVKPSETEKKLWGTAYQPQPNLSYDKLTEAQAERNLESTLELMRHSENPYFKNAAQDYDRFKKEGRALITVGTNDRINREEGGLTSPTISQDKIQAHTELSGPDVLRRYNALLLALLLAHEIEHQRNMLKYDEEMTSRPLNERLSLQKAKTQDRVYWVEEEARGNGISMQAFIHFVGLLSIPIYDDRPSSLVDNAYQFILNGSTVDNLGWKSYVIRTFINK